MAATTSLAFEGKWGNKRAKCYKVTWDQSDVRVAITPGIGFTKAIGAPSFINSGGTFTLSCGVDAPRTGSASFILFYGP